jgi:hypothetical protein
MVAKAIQALALNTQGLIAGAEWERLTLGHYAMSSDYKSHPH